jgi:hypothetical protein
MVKQSNLKEVPWKLTLKKSNYFYTLTSLLEKIY